MRYAANDLRRKVLKVLRDFPKSRDSDIWLTLKIWVEFYPQRIDRNDPDNLKVKLSDILDLPREDSVKRVRAIIQNEEHRFLPTCLEVARQRKINEVEWRNYISKGASSASLPYKND